MIKKFLAYAFTFALLSLIFAASAHAAPYFRVPGPNWKPATSYGACADPVNVGHSQACTVLGVVTHSHNDGYALVPGEDWALVSIGVSGSGEGVMPVLGPSLNAWPVLAWLQSLALPAKLVPSIKDGPVSGSFGPMWAYDPRGNKGYLRVFAGATWQF